MVRHMAMTPIYFNPRSRMGSDHGTARVGRTRMISIHAPAWGATVNAIVQKRLAKISIHAPAWGATWRSIVVRNGIGFHSTLPHGERPVRRFGPQFREISIHAPAWGATTSRCPTFPSSLFQSTLPHGERLIQTRCAIGNAKFQSTLPHGERQAVARLHQLQRRISIHAPAWGATIRLIPG